MTISPDSQEPINELNYLLKAANLKDKGQLRYHNITDKGLEAKGTIGKLWADFLNYIGWQTDSHIYNEAVNKYLSSAFKKLDKYNQTSSETPENFRNIEAIHAIASRILRLKSENKPSQLVQGAQKILQRTEQLQLDLLDKIPEQTRPDFFKKLSLETMKTAVTKDLSNFLYVPEAKKSVIFERLPLQTMKILVDFDLSNFSLVPDSKKSEIFNQFDIDELKDRVTLDPSILKYIPEDNKASLIELLDDNTIINASLDYPSNLNYVPLERLTPKLLNEALTKQNETMQKAIERLKALKVQVPLPTKITEIKDPFEQFRQLLPENKRSDSILSMQFEKDITRQKFIYESASSEGKLTPTEMRFGITPADESLSEEDQKSAFIQNVNQIIEDRVLAANPQEKQIIENPTNYTDKEVLDAKEKIESACNKIKHFFHQSVGNYILSGNENFPKEYQKTNVAHSMFAITDPLSDTLPLSATLDPYVFLSADTNEITYGGTWNIIEGEEEAPIATVKSSATINFKEGTLTINPLEDFIVSDTCTFEQVRRLEDRFFNQKDQPANISLQTERLKAIEAKTLKAQPLEVIKLADKIKNHFTSQTIVLADSNAEEKVRDIAKDKTFGNDTITAPSDSEIEKQFNKDFLRQSWQFEGEDKAVATLADKENIFMKLTENITDPIEREARLKLIKLFCSQNSGNAIITGQGNLDNDDKKKEELINKSVYKKITDINMLQTLKAENASSNAHDFSGKFTATQFAAKFNPEIYISKDRNVITYGGFYQIIDTEGNDVMKIKAEVTLNLNENTLTYKPGFDPEMTEEYANKSNLDSLKELNGVIDASNA